MQTNISGHDKNQLIPSFEKLFHYLLVHTLVDIDIEVSFDRTFDNVLYSKKWRAPKEISISPTLYTRIDDCHGAGNCCRVPFDLVYTNFDYQRILNFDFEKAKSMYGLKSAERFEANKLDLLSSMKELYVKFSFDNEFGGRHVSQSCLYVRKNTEEFHLSGKKSCPYLFVGDDRYFCGIHMFKPLHCWYPHMTVRTHEVDEQKGERTNVTIGRMQYGRNHNFGCPVVFIESKRNDQDLIFVSEDQRPSYFDSQFKDDYEKLKWTSDSAQSLGFSSNMNFAVGLHEQFLKKEREMRINLKTGICNPILLWRRNESNTH